MPGTVFPLDCSLWKNLPRLDGSAQVQTARNANRPRSLDANDERLCTMCLQTVSFAGRSDRRREHAAMANLSFPSVAVELVSTIERNSIWGCHASFTEFANSRRKRRSDPVSREWGTASRGMSSPAAALAHLRAAVIPSTARDHSTGRSHAAVPVAAPGFGESQSMRTCPSRCSDAAAGMTGKDAGREELNDTAGPLSLWKVARVNAGEHLPPQARRIYFGAAARMTRKEGDPHAALVRAFTNLSAASPSRIRPGKHRAGGRHCHRRSIAVRRDSSP